MQTLVTVCTLLVDSAESVAEATGDPEIRDTTFLFAKKVREVVRNHWDDLGKIRDEAKRLEEVRRAIDTNPNDPSIRVKLLQAAKNITSYT